ncbi:MAG: peptidase S41 [Cryomorphaceae bacterium]|nr:peptidase S41 [Cryomorphaceae bacterium]
MKRILALLLISITVLCCQSQNDDKYNLGFEKINEGEALPEGWEKWGDYDLSIENLAFSGKRSGKITSNENGDFGSIAYKIPVEFLGDSIKLEGFMKIKNVEGGFAGLLMRINGNGDVLAFDNMQKQNISGTKDWQKYSITLEYPEGAEYIFVAGILAGKGQAWFDNFVVTIDGENIQTIRQNLPKAILDKTFDNGSSIELSNLTPKNIDNLELLGRVWGFLKYHHPEIAKGNYNWDYELFRFLPKFMEAKNDNQRDKLVIEWVNSLGEVEPCKKCKPTSESAIIKPDLEWIYNQNEELKNTLLHIYNNRTQGKHHYIGKVSNAGNPEFKNENPYANMPFPDDGFRLLSLYRYWNMINYFFPYKHLMDEDWNKKLREYIPLFLQAKNEFEYEMVAVRIIGDIQDTHANLWGGGDKLFEWKGTNFPPVHLRFIKNQLVVTDYYNMELKDLVGLNIGDIITKINGVPVNRIVNEKAKYYPASNTPTRLRNISADLLRSSSDEIEIEFVSDNGKAQTMSLHLYPKDSLDIYVWYRKNNEKSYRMLDNNIGYVTLASITDEDIPNIINEFKDTKGIVIDIRNYPSAFVPFTLGSFFVSTSTPFVKFTNVNTDNPGEFTFTKELKIPSKGKTYKGKLIVLVNELTQSSAEYTSMAFRAGENTQVLGSSTAGADGNVSTIFLPGNLKTFISGIGVYYPNGDETQRIGIVPDIVVHPTVEGIRNGKDELLEKAMEVILGEKRF